MFWFVFNKNKLLVKTNHGLITVPGQEDVTASKIQLKREINVGTLYNRPCFAALVKDDSTVLPEGFKYLSIRKLLLDHEGEIFRMAGRAFQIMNWFRKHQFCGRCGASTEDKADELARVCPNCSAVSFPRISPAVIVAVVKGDKLLLARNVNFPADFYSVLAGFVEPGETLEECVQREIKEEVGIEVKNISYFGSQSWPFPDSLMIGFTAEYASGDIVVDNNEISHADWFSFNNLPENIPGKNAIAGRLIGWFLEQANPKK